MSSVDETNLLEEFDNHWGFDITCAGEIYGVDRCVSIKVFILGNINSSYFVEDINNYDILATQCFNGECWKVSLYTNKTDIDVSKIAKLYNGKGIKGASHYCLKQWIPPFNKMYKTSDNILGLTQFTIKPDTYN